jgi:hypothetical protein
MLEGNNDIAVGTELEVVSDDVGLVLANLVIICPTLLDAFEVPCNKNGI